MWYVLYFLNSDVQSVINLALICFRIRYFETTYADSKFIFQKCLPVFVSVRDRYVGVGFLEAVLAFGIL